MAMFIGYDIGSRNTKAVCYDSVGKSITFSVCVDTGVNPLKTVDETMQMIKAELGSTHLTRFVIYSTGYGRNIIDSDKKISEISCHAYGVQYFFPDVRTIIDIGGQDCKVISIDHEGQVCDFVMNDKCAAGTGRFLEMIALRLGIPFEDLDKLASQSITDIKLNSTCVVFAESEIIGLVSKGCKPEDIARSVNRSIAERVISQVKQLDWKNPVVFTGGVALNHDLVSLVARGLNCLISSPSHPETTGALGAALIASKNNEQS